MSQNLSIKPLAEGALLATTAVVMVLAGIYLPVAGMILVFLWPLPVILIHVRHGLRVSLMSVIVVGLVLSAFLGPIQAGGLVIASGLVGIAFGTGFRKRWNPGLTMIVAIGAEIAGFTVTFVITLYIMGINVLAEQAEIIRQSFDIARNVISRFGANPDAEMQINNLGQQIELTLSTLLPSMLLLGAALHAFITFLASRAVLNRLGMQVQALAPFSTWKFPPLLIIGYLFAFTAIYLSQSYHVKWAETVGMNLYVIFSMIYLVEGLSVTYFYLGKLQLAEWLKAFILVWVFFTPFLNQLAIWAGIADSLFDLRRLATR